MNDKELLRLLTDSPQEGLAAVIKKYSAYVYTIAYNKLSGVCPREDIEECVSDVFLKFYTSVTRQDMQLRSVSAYLSVITQRHCTDIFRRKTAGIECVSLDEIENTVYDEDITADSRDLIRAIERLGKPDSYIFLRRYYMGQPVRDIARDMKMNSSAVSKRLSRGLLKLKKILEEGS